MSDWPSEGRLDLSDRPEFGTNVIPLQMGREELLDGYFRVLSELYRTRGLLRADGCLVPQPVVRYRHYQQAPVVADLRPLDRVGDPEPGRGPGTLRPADEPRRRAGITAANTGSGFWAFSRSTAGPGSCSSMSSTWRCTITYGSWLRICPPVSLTSSTRTDGSPEGSNRGSWGSRREEIIPCGCSGDLGNSRVLDDLSDKDADWRQGSPISLFFHGISAC